MLVTLVTAILLLTPQDAGEVKALLASDSTSDQSRGHDAIAKLDSKDRESVLKFLVKLDEKLRKDYDSEVAKMTRLLDEKKIKKTLEGWEKARKKAMSAIFDTKKYPNPKKGQVIRGPFKGYSGVMGKYKSLESRYKMLASKIDAVLAAKPSEWWTDMAARADRIDEIAKTLTANRKPAKTMKRFAEPFWHAIAEFDSGDLDAGVKIYETPMTATQKKLLFFFYCRGFIKKESAQKCVEIMNVMRMKLGVLPFEEDDRLKKAMELHLDDMAANGYFGHYEQNADTKTPQQRCAKQGYKGMTGENISSSKDPQQSVDMWMWDGGHCRNMVNPRWQQIGLATKSSGTGFDAGTGDGVKNKRIQVLWKLPGAK